MIELKKINEKLITKEDLKTQLELTKDEILTRMNERLEKLELRIFTLEVEKDKLQKENQDLRKKTDKIDGDAHSAVFSSQLALKKLNDLEQYTRKNTVRMFGVSDNKDETAERTMEVAVGVLDKIGVNIATADIDIAHRIGKFQLGKQRPMIVKFMSRIHKNQALYQRRRLKGTGIGISEDLTAKKCFLFKTITRTRNCIGSMDKRH